MHCANALGESNWSIVLCKSKIIFPNFFTRKAVFCSVLTKLAVEVFSRLFKEQCECSTRDLWRKFLSAKMFLMRLWLIKEYQLSLVFAKGEKEKNWIKKFSR